MSIKKSDQEIVVYKASEWYEEINEAAQLLSNIVGSTFGPAGRLVSSDPEHTCWPAYTKDGVSVAGQIKQYNDLKQHIIDTIVQSADRQLYDCGDGTTLTIIVACKILQEAICRIHGDQDKRHLVKHDIIGHAERISQAIAEMAIPATEQNVKDIIRIALNSDVEMQELVCDAVEHVGEFGIIRKAFATNPVSSVVYDMGYRWDSGIRNDFMANIPGGFRGAVPYIMVVNDNIAHEDDLKGAKEAVIRHEAETQGVEPKNLDFNTLPTLVIIAPIFEGRAVAYAKKMLEQKVLRIIHIAPSGRHGSSDRLYHMANVAAFTGATLIDGGNGVDKKAVSIKHLGRCSLLDSDMLGTCFQGRCDVTADARIEHLQACKEKAKGFDPLEHEIIEMSIARLSSKVATIKVAGASESEIRERLDRVDDALKSAYSARELGVVPGGGVALLLADPRNLFVGHVAIDKIFENAGYDEIDDEFKKHVRESQGYDLAFATAECFSMVDRGIIDPAKNIISALRNAVSVVLMIVDTEFFLIKSRGDY